MLFSELAKIAGGYFPPNLVKDYISEIVNLSAESVPSFAQLSQRDQVIQIEYAALINLTIIDVTLINDKIKTWSVYLRNINAINKLRQNGSLNVNISCSANGGLHYAAMTPQAMNSLDVFVNKIIAQMATLK